MVLTGLTEDLDAKQFACVLRKPIDVEAFLSAVDQCLRAHKRVWRFRVWCDRARRRAPAHRFDDR